MNPKIIDWKGRRVWLVGASTGIGAALAHELAHRGARLALSARSADTLQALPRQLVNIRQPFTRSITRLEGTGGGRIVLYERGAYFIAHFKRLRTNRWPQPSHYLSRRAIHTL